MSVFRFFISFKDLFYWILLITITILFFKQCHKKPISIALANETEKKRLLDSSENVRVRQADSLTRQIALREDRVDSILGESEVYRYERNLGWATIKDRDNTIKSLASKVLSDKGTNDSDCVELAKHSQFQSVKIREQEDLTVKLLDDLHLLSKVKDSTISDERRIKDAALKQGLQTATAYSQLFEKFKKTQPRTQVFIGSDGYFNPEEMGVGGSIGFLNKNGTFYMAKTGITTNAQYYIGGSIMFRISFRKK